MELRKYPRLDETVCWERLPNGLTVAVVPRPGFSKKMAYFVTGAGALHRRFTMDGKAYVAPMGIAHYLEHKLFDMPGGRDVSAEFASQGASVNAFTSYDMTAYYFSCTENFTQCLRLLLDFVSTPYFTEDSVAREQGIIAQEIDMNEDAPENKVFENLANGMYRVHPIREPILGTRQTIGEITPQVLYDYHRACYRPENMLLCVAGDVDPAEVRELAGQLDMECPEVTMDTIWEESLSCEKAMVSGQMEVARPMFQLGFKCRPFGTGEQAVYWEFVGDLACEVLFGESSDLYSRLYEEGLIDPSFGGGLDTVPGMAMVTVSGDSDDPEKVRDAILQQAKKLSREGIPEQTFLRIKRSTMGERIRALDSFDSVLFRLCAYHFTGFDYFEFPKIYESIQASDVQKFLADLVTEQVCCLSVIYPKEESL